MYSCNERCVKLAGHFWVFRKKNWISQQYSVIFKSKNSYYEANLRIRTLVDRLSWPWYMKIPLLIQVKVIFRSSKMRSLTYCKICLEQVSSSWITNLKHLNNIIPQGQINSQWEVPLTTHDYIICYDNEFCDALFPWEKNFFIYLSAFKPVSNGNYPFMFSRERGLRRQFS